MMKTTIEAIHGLKLPFMEVSEHIESMTNNVHWGVMFRDVPIEVHKGRD